MELKIYVENYWDGSEVNSSVAVQFVRNFSYYILTCFLIYDDSSQSRINVEISLIVEQQAGDWLCKLMSEYY